MKSLLFSICSIICVITFQAQEQTFADFEWSELTNNRVSGSLSPILAFPSESGFTMYSVEKFGSQFYAPKIINITKFDAFGKPTSAIDFKLPIRLLKDAALLKIIEGDNKLYFFSNIALN